MDLHAFVLEWTGHGFSLGIDWYAVQFEPDSTYPLGLRLCRAWSMVPEVMPIDPLHVPDPIIEAAESDAAEIYVHWGHRVGVVWLEFHRRHKIWYNPDHNPGLSVPQVHALLDIMFEADHALRH